MRKKFGDATKLGGGGAGGAFGRATYVATELSTGGASPAARGAGAARGEDERPVVRVTHAPRAGAVPLGHVCGKPLQRRHGDVDPRPAGPLARTGRAPAPRPAELRGHLGRAEADEGPAPALSSGPR